MQNKLIDILLVEDSDSEIMLLKEVFTELTSEYNLYVVKDGIEAISFLSKQGKYSNVPEPSIVLLDINLPKKNGYEVLQEVKENDALKHIPIIMLTSSSREVMSSYKHCANAFLKKPLDYDKYIDIVKSIEHFWFQNAQLPSQYN